MVKGRNGKIDRRNVQENRKRDKILHSKSDIEGMNLPRHRGKRGFIGSMGFYIKRREYFLSTLRIRKT